MDGSVKWGLFAWSEGKCDIFIRYHPEGQVYNMFIFQLQRLSNASSLVSKIPVHMNYRQVFPEGLWDSYAMKSNGKHALLSMKICILCFASLRKAEQRGEKLRNITRMDFCHHIWKNEEDISVFCGEKEKRRRRNVSPLKSRNLKVILSMFSVLFLLVVANNLVLWEQLSKF